VKKILNILLLFIVFLQALNAQIIDHVAPEKPTMLSLTVDTADNKAVLTWLPSTSADVAHYILLKKNGSMWNASDTVSFKTLSTKATASEAGKKSETYAIIAEDSTKNTSLIEGSSGIYSTIFLKAQYDSCSYAIVFNWNNYSPMPDESSQFLLHICYKNTGWLAAPVTLQGNIFQYTTSDVAGNIQSAFIEKKYNNTTVSSNKIEVESAYFPQLYADSIISTVEDNKTKLKLFYSNGVTNEKLLIYNGKNCETQNLLATITPDPSGILYFEDSETDVNLARTYTIQIQNRCNNIVQTLCQSPIVLTGKQVNFGIQLNWNNYTAQSLDLYRIINNQETYISSFTDTSYIDGWDNITTESGGDVCYIIKNKMLNIQSNQFCFQTSGLAIIPDAFTPDGNGKNDFFKPVFPGYTPNQYQLTIFDNKGRLVYNSKSATDNGWDGRQFGQNPYNGQVLLYLLQYTDNKQHSYTRRGSVTILLP
jgi:gliding motility-associated-like protein